MGGLHNPEKQGRLFVGEGGIAGGGGVGPLNSHDVFICFYAWLVDVCLWMIIDWKGSSQLVVFQKENNITL